MAKDYFNREIEVGDMVVHPVRRGSFLYVNHGIVLETQAQKIKIRKKGNANSSWIERTDRCIIVYRNGYLELPELF